MKTKDFEKLVKKDKYQLFLFVSAAHFPYFFAVHPWFVLNEKGQLTRWEILHKRDLKENIHLYKNAKQPTEGISVFSNPAFFKWSSKLIGISEGDKNSSTAKAIRFIESSKELYPYSRIYALRGTNSNTYAQWILNNFPDLKLKLPWNAFGKNYKHT
jgi:hypothetical protein